MAEGKDAAPLGRVQQLPGARAQSAWIPVDGNHHSYGFHFNADELADFFGLVMQKEVQQDAAVVAGSSRSKEKGDK